MATGATEGGVWGSERRRLGSAPVDAPESKWRAVDPANDDLDREPSRVIKWGLVGLCVILAAAVILTGWPRDGVFFERFTRWLGDRWRWIIWVGAGLAVVGAAVAVVDKWRRR